MNDQAPAVHTTTHFTMNGDRAVCGNPSARRFAFDPNDNDVTCDGCRLYLAGYRAGRNSG